MARKFKMMLMTGVALAAVGIWATGSMACDGAKKASAEKASVGSCSSSAQKASVGKASSGSCTASATAAKAEASCGTKATAANAGANCGTKATTANAGAACGSKTVSAGAMCQTGQSCDYAKVAALGDMPAFAFVKEAGHCTDKVKLNVQKTDSGFAFVFAAADPADVAQAKQLAQMSLTTMGKPAACSATRASMADGGCDMTKACLNALADAEIVVVDTENGAMTLVQSKNETKVQELHGFLATLMPTPKDSDS